MKAENAIILKAVRDLNEQRRTLKTKDVQEGVERMGFERPSYEEIVLAVQGTWIVKEGRLYKRQRMVAKRPTRSGR